MKSFQEFLDENKGHLYVCINPENENGKYELIYKASEESKAEIISSHLCAKDAENAKREYIKNRFSLKYYGPNRISKVLGITNSNAETNDNAYDTDE